MSEQSLVEATDSAGTVGSLTADLLRLGVHASGVLCLHSSLSSLGWVCGGAVAVLEALRAVLGPDGTLVVPTHTGGLTDPGGWSNPPVPRAWWPAIRNEMPPFRADLTPSHSMGAIAELVRSSPGACRSDHPQVSFAALGPQAHFVTDGHDLDHMLGEGSQLARLYDLDAEVLLLGVGHDRNTSLHLAEYRAGVRPVLTERSPRLVDGRSTWVEWDDIDLDESDFVEIGAAFETAGTDVRIGTVGIAAARLMSQRRLFDFATSWLQVPGSSTRGGSGAQTGPDQPRKL